jgi:hypothetical protein
MGSSLKTSPEFNRFNALVGRVLSVPKAVLDRRIEEYDQQAKANPKRRGPKSKKTTQKEAQERN